MKTFQEYLTENKKIYSFKVKVAGDIPEKFLESLKDRLEKYRVVTIAKMKSTPIQKTPLDFPTMENKEVHVFDVVLEYPVTSPQISLEIKEMGLNEECFRVRGSGEPSEIDQILADGESTGEPILAEPDYKDAKIKHKDYFGDDFNRGFLKDLAKAAKERVKAGTGAEYKMPKNKQDKTGTKSAIGS